MFPDRFVFEFGLPFLALYLIFFLGLLRTLILREGMYPFLDPIPLCVTALVLDLAAAIQAYALVRAPDPVLRRGGPDAAVEYLIVLMVVFFFHFTLYTFTLFLRARARSDRPSSPLNIAGFLIGVMALLTNGVTVATRFLLIWP
jgi:hypothetical protein